MLQLFTFVVDGDDDAGETGSLLYDVCCFHFFYLVVYVCVCARACICVGTCVCVCVFVVAVFDLISA